MTGGFASLSFTGSRHEQAPLTRAKSRLRLPRKTLNRGRGSAKRVLMTGREAHGCPWTGVNDALDAPTASAPVFQGVTCRGGAACFRCAQRPNHSRPAPALDHGGFCGGGEKRDHNAEDSPYLNTRVQGQRSGCDEGHDLAAWPRPGLNCGPQPAFTRFRRDEIAAENAQPVSAGSQAR